MHLVVEPYVDTVVVAGGLLRRAGGEVATALLEKIVAGTAIVALGRHRARRPASVGRMSRPPPNAMATNGCCAVARSSPMSAPAGHTSADVHSRAPPNGISLFLVEVDSAATALEAHRYRTVDDRRASDLVFDGLRLPASALLGNEGAGMAVAGPSARRRRGRDLCGSVGCMRKVLADTVEYCKQRQQFGQPIGSFQVLQHRMVDMYMELEQAVAAVYLAVLNLDAEPATRARCGIGREGDDRAGGPLHRPAGSAAARRDGHDRGTGDRPLFQAADRHPVRVRLDRASHRAVRRYAPGQVRPIAALLSDLRATPSVTARSWS